MARVEPRTYSLEKLIQEVREGVLRIPRFHRGFVWRRDQVLELLESIRLRYPIGSLLIWRTRERYESFQMLGPIGVPEAQPVASVEFGYVLDGHQRLSTLYGVLSLNDEAANALKGSERVFLVYFDLDQEKFVHARHPGEQHLPVRYLLSDGDQLTQWIDERRDSTTPGSPQRLRWDMFRRRAMQLQITFAQYRIHSLDFTDASMEEAVHIFTRLNSSGSPTRADQVFLALTARQNGFDFASSASNILQQVPLFANFGQELILRALLAALGESLHREDWREIEKKHRSVLPKIISEVESAFVLATRFIAGDFGAASGKVVPYALQLVLLTEFFRRCPDPSARARETLLNWLWGTSFSSIYTSSGNVHFDAALEQARRLATGDDVSLLPDERLTLRPFPRRFHPKAARVRVFHLFLKTRQPRNLRTGDLLNQNELYLNGMADARPATSVGGSHSWRLASRLLIGAGAGSVQDALRATATHPRRDEILRSHVIPLPALQALLSGDPDTFLQLREEALIQEERAFARQYVDIPSPSEEPAVEEEAEIDVEEAPESDLM